MPMLFSLGLHAALMALAARLREGERLLAFLDDLYIVTSPDRTVEVHNILREELWCHARISLHQGKTRIWNRWRDHARLVQHSRASCKSC